MSKKKPITQTKIGIKTAKKMKATLQKIGKKAEKEDEEINSADEEGTGFKDPSPYASHS